MIAWILSQFFMVLLPGLVVVRFAGFRKGESIKDFFLAYASGYAFCILLYSILALTNLQELSFYVTVISSILCLVLLIFDIRKHGFFDFQVDVSDAKFILVLILVLFCIMSITGLLENHFVGKRTELKIDQDLMYWFRNSVAASRKFPLEDLSIAGTNFYYHYFSSFYNAYIHLVTGIELFDICFTYSIFTNVILLSGSVFVFSDYFFKEKLFKYISVFIMLFCVGFEHYAVIGYSTHLYVNSFGTLEGISLLLFSFVVFLHFFDSDAKTYKKMFLSLLLFYSAVGVKAPLACVFMVPLGIACVYMLFNKKTMFKGGTYGVICLSIFAFVYLLFIRGINHPVYIAGETNSLSFNPVAVLKRGDFERFYFFLQKLFCSKVISGLIVFLVYIIALNPLLLYMFSYSLCDLKKKNLTQKQILIASGIITGFLLNLCLSHAGNSQAYFFFPVIPLATVFSLDRIKKIKQKSNFIIPFVFLIVLGLFNFLFSMYKDGSDGVVHYIKATYMNKIMEKNDKTVSEKEIEGMRWLRDNSDEDSIVVTNKILSKKESGRSFVVSSFSERQVFIEGDDYGAVPSYISKIERKKTVRSFFEGDLNAVNELKEYGVSYAVIFKSFFYDKKLEENAIIVYENPEILILKL